MEFGHLNAEISPDPALTCGT